MKINNFYIETQKDLIIYINITSHLEYIDNYIITIYNAYLTVISTYITEKKYYPIIYTGKN